MREVRRYVPGAYTRRIPTGAKMASDGVLEWEVKRLRAWREKQTTPRVLNCISFSRKIGVGALEIADKVSEKLNMKVVDREIIDTITRDHDLRELTVESFDDRYPGTMNTLMSMLLGETATTPEEYLQYLAGAVYSLADADPTIFVGRASHLILPRRKVLAVRLIASPKFRVRRIAEILGVDEKIAKEEMINADNDQKEYFAKYFQKNEASPYEFDLVINRDFLQSADTAAEIIAAAYRGRFDL